MSEDDHTAQIAALDQLLADCGEGLDGILESLEDLSKDYGEYPTLRYFADKLADRSDTFTRGLLVMMLRRLIVCRQLHDQAGPADPFTSP